MKKIPIVIQASNIDESIEGRQWRYLNENETVIGYLIHRLQNRGHDSITIATSDNTEDDSYEQLANELNVSIVRGSFSDIPSRLIQAAEGMNEKDFVRLFANNPLVDICKMEELYHMHTAGNYDYSYNEHRTGVLWGMGCDIFNIRFLNELTNTGLTNTQKETIGQYIRQNDDLYNVNKYINCRTLPEYKVSIETERNYEVVCELVHNLQGIDTESVVDYLDNHPVIAKYGNEEPPKEVGIEKLLLSHEKVDFIIKHHLPDMTYPISVELTLTNRCNLACVYCSDLELRTKQGVGEYLDLDTIKSLFQDLANGGTKGVVLEGGGEPTMHPQFSEIVWLARSVGLAVGLITNGTCSLDGELLEQFEWIRVSLDASTAKEYKELKGVDYFEKVIGNIAEYAKVCKTVGIGYVVTKVNVSEIEPLIVRLREIGASYIQCRPVVDNPELFPEEIDLSYLKYYQTSKFAVMIDGMKENETSGNNGLPCYAHSITSIISGDGSVYICGRLNIYDWLKPIGNIREKSFRKIWYGEERQNQAEMLLDEKFCRNNCPQCRISKFNQLFYRLEHVQSKHFI